MTHSTKLRIGTDGYVRCKRCGKNLYTLPDELSGEHADLCKKHLKEKGLKHCGMCGSTIKYYGKRKCSDCLQHIEKVKKLSKMYFVVTIIGLVLMFIILSTINLSNLNDEIKSTKLVGKMLSILVICLITHYTAKRSNAWRNY